jgi:eukaryotic-like serine/threonine-protein kinase
MAADEAEPGPGVLVAGRYRISALIGEGGMGAVWRATDEVLGREVAVKRVRLGAQLAGAALTHARTMREARIAAALHHPHIVTIFDVVEHDDPWLILEYLPSRSLGRIVAERGTIAVKDVAAIGAQIADALAAAHDVGIVHRDVKPDNILIAHQAEGGGAVRRPGPVAKLTDFGISHAADLPALTATGFLTGTPGYFAPETARGDGTDARTDVYSLGAVLYAAVEGHLPFGNNPDNLLALLARIGRGGAPAPQRAGALTDLLQRLLADDAAARPTAAEAHDELQRLAGAYRDTPTLVDAPAALPGEDRPHPTRTAVPTEAGTDPTVAHTAPSSPRAARGGRRRLVVAGIGPVAVVAIAATVALTADRDAAAPPRLPTHPLPLRSRCPPRSEGSRSAIHERPIPAPLSISKRCAHTALPSSSGRGASSPRAARSSPPERTFSTTSSLQARPAGSSARKANGSARSPSAVSARPTADASAAFCSRTATSC